MIIQILANTILKVRYKFLSRGKAIDICEQLSGTQKVLIFMPTKIEQFGAALKALERLREIKPNWELTVISRLEMVSFIDEKIRAEIIPYSKDDVNLVGLPKHSIKQLFQKTSFDLALDFKLQFDPLGVSLFHLSNAPIRACIDSDEKSQFYNFGIRVGEAETLVNRYNTMVKYITTMAGSKEPLSQPKTKVPSA